MNAYVMGYNDGKTFPGVAVVIAENSEQAFDLMRHRIDGYGYHEQACLFSKQEIDPDGMVLFEWNGKA